MASSRPGGSTQRASLDLLLGADGVTYLRTAGVEPGEAADLTPAPDAKTFVELSLDWAVRSCLSDSPWSRRQSAGHLERACGSRTAGEFAIRTGTREVVQGAPPVGTPGPSVRATWAGDTDARCHPQWRVPASCSGVSPSALVLSALWTMAERAGQGAAVHHGLYALRGGFERSGFFAPSVASDLVASLVTFGIDMAAADEHAHDSRARLRVV